MLLAALSASIPSRPTGFVRVAIDGVDGSGKSVFAAALAQALADVGRPAVVIHVDDFHHVRAVRYRLGRDSPQGFWLDSYDYDALRREVLDPFGADGDGRFRAVATDLDTDAPVVTPQRQAAPGTVAIVEGIFLHRDELRDDWDRSVFLDVPFDITADRMARRDGTPADPAHPAMRRYVEGQRIYLEACQPRSRATWVVDNSDWSRPRFVGLSAAGDAGTAAHPT